jgi:DNA-directed RNA polymerase specialized sigma24 family protein
MSKGGPTQDGFDKLLRWLDPDRDIAGAKYGKIQSRLISFFSVRGCGDADDLADATFNVVMSRIDWLMENYVGEPMLYFYGVARKIYLESIKPKPKPDPPPPGSDGEEIEEVFQRLEDCLQELSAEERDWAIRYHQGDKRQKIENRKKLADELRISRNALRIRLCHIHSRLRDCILRLQQLAVK